MDRRTPPSPPGRRNPAPLMARMDPGGPRAAGRSAWLRSFIHWRVFAGAFVLACLLLMTVLFLAWITRPARSNMAVATAMLQVIPASTSTPTNDPNAAGPGSGTAVPTPQPGVIAQGSFVQVTGTGGDGLRMRDAAGLNAKVLIVASEAEVFKVADGPKELDGYTWWYLVGPFDAQRRGWAVMNYLQVVQGP